jgi:hypothetical protein
VSLQKRSQASKSGCDWFPRVSASIKRNTFALGVASAGEELVDVIVDPSVVLVVVGRGAHVADVGEECLTTFQTGFAQGEVQQLA